MQNLYFKFLNEFEQTGLSERKSISPFMERYFTKPTADHNEPIRWSQQNRNSDLFLEDIRNTGHFDFERDETGDIKPGRWYDVVNIYARITIAGLAYLDAYKANKRVLANSNAQTLAIFLTVFITIATLIVSILNSTSSNQLNELQTRIQEQNLQINTLQTELFQATNKTHRTK